MTSKGSRSATHDDDSYLEEDLDKDTWTSPTKKGNAGTAHMPSQSSAKPETGSSRNTKSHDVHEQNLHAELASVRKVNEAIEGVLESLKKAKSNMKNVNQTVTAASSLLNVWTRILSQTEHNQRLILDPTWQGASQDVQNMEDEALARQQAAERREAEDQERKAMAARRLEEEERKKAEVVSRTNSSTRGRSNLSRSGSTRNTASANTSTTRGISSTRRPASGIGRGVRGTRSRS